MKENNSFLEVEIMTPQDVKFKGTALSINVPAIDGRIGVLTHHAPLVALVEAGETRVETDVKTFIFANGQGFIWVNENKASLMLDRCFKPEEIDYDESMEKIKDIKNSIKGREKSLDYDVIILNGQLKVENAKITVYQKVFGYKK